MTEFITIITSFPVIIFTFFMGLVLCYWLLVIIGALDLEILDVSGINEIPTESSAGSIEGLESGETTGLSGILANWGLTGVPMTIVASIITSSSWFLSSVITATLFPYITSPPLRFLAGLGLLVVVVAISIPFTAKMVRPMRKFFRASNAVRKSSFVGRDCVVKTSTVTDSFGQGEVFDGEAGIIVNIIATVPNEIIKDDVVLLVEYDQEKDSYHVAKI